MRENLNVILLVAVIALSIITYRQQKQINDLYYRVYDCESQCDSLESNYHELDRNFKLMGSTLSDFAGIIEELYYRH